MVEESGRPAGESPGLAAFFSLTFAVSWLAWGALAVFRIPGGSVSPAQPAPPALGLALLALGGFAPSIVGVLLTARFGGRVGLRELWRRSTRFNLGRWPYAVILLAPAAVAFARIAVQLLRGGGVSLPEPLARPALMAPLLVQLFLFGPVSEELGWRGFALDRLLARSGPFRASLFLGAVHGLWHLPLFFVPGTIQQLWGSPVSSFAVFALGTMAGAFVFTWLHRATRGSVGAAIAYHLAANVGTSLVWMSFGGDLLDRLVAAVATVGVAASLAAAIRKQNRPDRRKQRLGPAS